MRIRPLNESDLPQVTELIRAAFSIDEGPGVANLVLALLDDETARPLLALVAEDEEPIVGVILFTRATVAGHDDLSLSILAPMAVLPARQGQGVGRALIEEGLHQLTDAGVDIVMVYGDPAFYGRFGFRAGHRLSAPYALQYPEAWLSLALTPGILEQVQGQVSCARALQVPEYW